MSWKDEQGWTPRDYAEQAEDVVYGDITDRHAEGDDLSLAERVWLARNDMTTPAERDLLYAEIDHDLGLDAAEL